MHLQIKLPVLADQEFIVFVGILFKVSIFTEQVIFIDEIDRIAIDVPKLTPVRCKLYFSRKGPFKFLLLQHFGKLLFQGFKLRIKFQRLCCAHRMVQVLSLKLHRTCGYRLLLVLCCLFNIGCILLIIATSAPCSPFRASFSRYFDLNQLLLNCFTCRLNSSNSISCGF